MISDKVFKNADEFVDALYSDDERLNRIREHLRIRGFGFDFETKYTVNEDEENASVPEEKEEQVEDKAEESED